MPIFGPKCQFWAKFGRFWAPNPIFWGQGVKILVPSYRDSNETPFSCWKHWSVGLKLAARGENVLFWPQNLDIWGQKAHFAPSGQLEPHWSMFSTRKRCLIGIPIRGYQNFYSLPPKNCIWGPKTALINTFSRVPNLSSTLKSTYCTTVACQTEYRQKLNKLFFTEAAAFHYCSNLLTRRCWLSKLATFSRCLLKENLSTRLHHRLLPLVGALPITEHQQKD